MKCVKICSSCFSSEHNYLPDLTSQVAGDVHKSIIIIIIDIKRSLEVKEGLALCHNECFLSVTVAPCYQDPSIPCLTLRGSTAGGGECDRAQVSHGPAVHLGGHLGEL